MITVRKELIYLTKQLILFKTTPENKKEIQNCFLFIQKYLKDTGLYLNTFNSKGTPSLLVSNSQTKSPDLLINGHIDVVEASFNQFNPFIKDNKIYGRGAIDMKGSVAVIMLLMKNLPKNSSGKIVSLFVSDEEIDGENGTKYILSKRFKPKFTIIAEESNFDIIVQQKGGFVLNIKTYGKKAHSAEPWKGENAIDKAIEIYQSFEKGLGTNKSALFKPTINMGKFNGGTNANFVADLASFDVDIRFTNKIEEKRIVDKISSLKKKEDVKITVRSYKRAMRSGGGKRQIEILADLVKKIVGKTPIIKKTPYSGDGRFFTEYNLPVVEFGPVGANYHADNEYVKIDSLEKYYQMLDKFRRSL